MPSPADQSTFFKYFSQIKKYLQTSVKGIAWFASLTESSQMKGSMTVEAAFVLPVVLSFFLYLMSVMEMLRLHGGLEAALWNVGNQLTLYCETFEEQVEGLPDTIVSYVAVHSGIKDFLGTDCHKVITTAASIVDNEKYIAVLTPECLYYALLKNPNMNFNYLFIDEAHKISDKDKRSITYYKILDMLKNKSDVNIYFSSPIIPNPDIYLELTNFYAGESRSAMGQVFRFSPVVQNKVYLDFINQQVSITNNLSANRIICNSMPVNISNKFQALISLGINKCNLVYVSSAK